MSPPPSFDESIAPFTLQADLQGFFLNAGLTFYWDVATLEWVKGTQVTASGGGAVTIADGADANAGSTTDAVITSDTTGTLSGKLRGLVKWAYERMPASLGQTTMAASLPVTLASNQSAVSVTSAASATATKTTVADAAADTLLLAANASRLGFSVANDSSAALFLSLGTVAASTTSYTAKILSGGYYEAPITYTGQVRGIWASDPGDGAARITELT